MLDKYPSTLDDCKQNLRMMLDFYFEIMQNKTSKCVSSSM